MDYLKRFTKWQGIFMMACMTVSLIALVGIVTGGQRETVGDLKRPELSAEESVQRVTVIRENGDEQLIDICLEARRLSPQEAEAVFAEVRETLPELLCGQNVSLEQVQSDLFLPDELESFGVRLIWESMSPEWISDTGQPVSGRVQTGPEPAVLEVTMILQEYQQTMQISLTILPEEEPSWEERLSAELSRVEETTRDSHRLVLPEIFEGETIRFARQTDVSKKAGLAMLPATSALLLFTEKGQKEDKKRKKRREEIAADYPELIVKMTVLYQAGLSMRGVWERIGADAKKKGGRMRPIYEEVCFACNSMADGISEPEAYRQFGRRCCTAGCLKLGNLLAGNVRRGTRHLSELMAQESARAWEMRKHQARRNGEKAGTKMLIPMFMMFGVVLAMVIIPAFYGFMI